MNRFVAATALTASLATTAFAESHSGTDNPMVGGASMFPTKTIVENAVNSADHTTLVAAVKAAGLVDTLSGPGPFTVFAPTNDAFAVLPEGTVDKLLKPEMKGDLTEVLTCHVAAAEAMAMAIKSMIDDHNGTHPVETLGGCTLQATYDGDKIMLEDEQGRTATVTIADVKQSNCVIHVIDTVLLPAAKDNAMEQAAMEEDTEMKPEIDAEMADADGPMVGGAKMFPERNIVENTVNSADHTTLVAAVKAAGLVEALSGAGPFTVFAPTNKAFDALLTGTVDTLLKPENKDQLSKVLTAHVVSGNWSAKDLIGKARGSADGFYHIKTVSGDALSAKATTGGMVFILDEHGSAYEVTQADVTQSNGVIHVVEGVLLPR